MSSNVKIYLLTVSPLEGDDHRISRLSYWLQHSAVVNGYWNYIPFVFAIKSYLGATELTSNLKPVLGAHYLITEINIHNMDGQLPQSAWAWFQEPPSLNLHGIPPLSSTVRSLSQLGQMYESGKPPPG